LNSSLRLTFFVLFPHVQEVCLQIFHLLLSPEHGLIAILIGDLSNWGWDDKDDMGATTRPLGVEVYKITDSEALEGWKEPESPKYTGLHGMRMPQRENDGTGFVGL
jgi:hypothetical protein